MKIYVVSVIFKNNTTKIKYVGTDAKKAYSLTDSSKYPFVIETWENEVLIDTDIIENIWIKTVL